MIRIRNLIKTFGSQLIFCDFNCDFADGGKYLIAGESGIGKTTLLRMITGLDRPDQGRIESDEEMTFAMVFQEDRLIDDMSAVENVQLVNPHCPVSVIRQRTLRRHETEDFACQGTA